MALLSKTALLAVDGLAFSNPYAKATRALAKGTTVTGVIVGYEAVTFGDNPPKAYAVLRTENGLVRCTMTEEAVKASNVNDQVTLIKRVETIEGAERHFMEFVELLAADTEVSVGTGQQAAPVAGG